jgi:hypothetical protein
MAQVAKNKCPIYFTKFVFFPVLTGRFRPHEVLTEAASAADATALLKQMHAAEAMYELVAKWGDCDCDRPGKLMKLGLQ